MLDLKVKGQFFDRKKVINALSKSNHAAMLKAGAFLRTRAKTSMPYRKSSSKPGMPPHSHRGYLRKFMLFSYDESSQSVVVGPAKIITKGQKNVKPISGPVPNILEYGGTVLAFQVHMRKTGWVSAKQKFKKSYKSRKMKTQWRRETIEERPYMRPAYAKELAAGTIMTFWNNSFGK